MKKLYYSDPLQVAYMSREFDVKFEELRRAYWELDWADYLSDNFINPYMAGSKIKFYIHADSYCIFEPMEGDRNINGYVFKNGNWLDDASGNGWIQSEEYPIDKRNNTAFFTPKVEK